MTAWVRSLKDMQPCTDCGVRYPWWIMQYDHIGGDKEGDISNAVNQGWGKTRILEEIAKCELVCANCHATRTHMRRQALLAQKVERTPEKGEVGSSSLPLGAQGTLW
jgi:hypothetical protein